MKIGEIKACSLREKSRSSRYVEGEEENEQK